MTDILIQILAAHNNRGAKSGGGGGGGGSLAELKSEPLRPAAQIGHINWGASNQIVPARFRFPIIL